jgi:hypothetical protein
MYYRNQAFQLHLTTDEETSGLPEGTIEIALWRKAKEKKAGSTTDYLATFICDLC